MPRRMLSLIAATLAACTTVTRVSVAPDQLPALAGMNPHDERAVTPIGDAEPVTVRGSDELLLKTRSGIIPASTGAYPEDQWARIDTLRSDPPRLSVVPPTHPGQAQWSHPAQVPITEVSGADLKLSRAAPVNTALLVTGIVLGTVAVLVGGCAIAIAASGGIMHLKGPLFGSVPML